MDLCGWLTLSPNLAGIADPIPYLQIIAEWVRVGMLATGAAAVLNRTVKGYLWDVAQIFSRVGASDPYLDSLGHVNCCLGQQLWA